MGLSQRLSEIRTISATRGHDTTTARFTRTPVVGSVSVEGPHPADVLIVDDEPDLADMVGEITANLGLKTVVVYDADAFQRCFDPGIRFIVLDLNMPDLDGIEYIRWLGEQGCRSSLILMSGMSDRILTSAREVAEGHGLTVLGCITKPFDVDAVEAMVGTEGRRDQTWDAAKPKSFTVAQVVDAIEGGQIVPYYQPKIDLNTGTVSGIEALARWDHPVRGLVFPGDFLPQVREAGAEHALTLRMLDTVLADHVRWRSAGLDMVASLNVEPGSLSEVGFPDLLLARLERQAVPAGRLLLEVTETAALEHLLNALENMLRLRMKGVGFAIDDFGTGHANMSQLCNLPFTQLKVDRSFVSRIGTSREATIIVESNIDLARRFGLEVVAEGVEDMPQARQLHKLGCDQIQGFLVSRAISGDALQEWVTAWQAGSRGAAFAAGAVDAAEPLRTAS